MKKSKILLALLMVFTSCVNAQVNTGLVSYYSFNKGDVTDQKSLHNATNYGATFVADRFGHANSALDFTGLDQNQYISVGHQIVDMSKDFSICVWLYVDAMNTADASTLVSSRFNSSGTESGGVEFALEKDSTFIGAFRKTTPSLSTLIDVRGGKIPSLEKAWHFAVFSRKSDTMKWYFDDVLAFSKPIPAGYNCENSSYWTFGSGKNSSGLYREFDGHLDDIRYYSRSLNSKEVDTLWKINDHPASVNKVENANSMSIYPNPANTELKINLENSSTVQIFNNSGQKVMETSMKAGLGSLNISMLQAGVYFVLVKSNEDRKTFSAQFIKN